MARIDDTADTAPVTAPAPSRDWPAEAAARVEDFVELLRDKSVRPVQRAVGYVIFGVVAFFLLIVLTVLLCVAIVRVLDVFVFAGRVWASDTLLGGIFCLLGMFLLSRRERSRRGADT